MVYVHIVLYRYIVYSLIMVYYIFCYKRIANDKYTTWTINRSGYEMVSSFLLAYLYFLSSDMLVHPGEHQCRQQIISLIMVRAVDNEFTTSYCTLESMAQAWLRHGPGMDVVICDI